MTEKYIAPSLRAKAFNCPVCGVLAQQRWSERLARLTQGKGPMPGASVTYSSCSVCAEHCLWVGATMVYPPARSGPQPAEDMPDDVKADYDEARSIAQLSPRGAAAMLRLALQKLMPHLGVKGKDLHGQIGYLVQQGLPVEIQQALDSLRVIGNNAVHPGKLDIRDDQETVKALFGVLNLIVDRMITQPKKVQELYATLPKNALDSIQNRDKNSLL